MGGAAVSLPRDSRRSSRSLSLLRDERLGARASKGDRAAFAELYRRHHQRLFRYCLAILHDAEDAADALQTTMAKALSALEGGETVRGVRPWMFRIAHNTSIDTVRGRRPQVDLEDLAETESSTLTAPSAASEAEERAELVQAVADIRDLPDRQAGALVMRELSGLAYPEIAAALDTSAGNARQLVHGARSALHAMRRGRDMDCEVVRLALGEADGKTPRDRRVRGHLENCEECRTFQKSIRTRRSALAVVVPPLAPWAAGDILGRLLERGSGSGAALAAGGGSAVGWLAKIAAVPAANLAAGAAAVGTAVLAGGFAAAGAGLPDGDRSGRAAPASVSPDTLDAPDLRPLPESASAPRRAERRRTRASEPAPGPADAPPRTPAVDRAARVKRDPVSRFEPKVPDGRSERSAAAVAVADEPQLELGTARLLDSLVSDAEILDLSENLDLPVDLDHLSLDSNIRIDLDRPLDRIELPIDPDDLPDGVDVPVIDPPDIPAGGRAGAPTGERSRAAGGRRTRRGLGRRADSGRESFGSQSASRP